MQSKIQIIVIILFIVLAVFLFYSLIKKEGFYPLPIWNFGSREWWPTRNMSYDIRGEPIIRYYGTGPFNQPEYPFRYGVPLFVDGDDYRYTYQYYVPGLQPPIFATPYSVPFAVNDDNDKRNTNTESKNYSKYRK